MNELLTIPKIPEAGNEKYKKAGLLCRETGCDIDTVPLDENVKRSSVVQFFDLLSPFGQADRNRVLHF